MTENSSSSISSSYTMDKIGGGGGGGGGGKGEYYDDDNNNDGQYSKPLTANSYDSENESEELDEQPRSSFSKELLKTGNNIVETYYKTYIKKENTRSSVMLANLQSGKTETYLFSAFECFRKNIIKHMVIFSGNAEIDLRDQLHNIVKDVKKKHDEKTVYTRYFNYLCDNHNNPDKPDYIHVKDMNSFIDRLKSKIRIIWGSELNKYIGPISNTLFIWDESHYAQNVNQRPDKFLKKIGISADGNHDNLNKNNNYILTVSATPFSELSDIYHLVQSKKIYLLRPGIGYKGVKDIYESNHLIPFTSIKEGLETALRTFVHSSPKYGIIRVSNKNINNVKDNIKEYDPNIDIHIYNSLTIGTEKMNSEQIWKNMKNIPKRNTIIIIQGKCRMGQTLVKKHIRFVMETVKNSNSDTIFQSLLGRTCGYDTGSGEIDVYLNETIINSGEIERYIKLMNADESEIQFSCIPTKARNIEKSRTACNNTGSIIPIKITRDDITTASHTSTDIILKYINTLFTNNTHSHIKNENDSIIFQEIREKYIKNHNDNNNHPFLLIHYLDKTKKTKGIETAMQIQNAFLDKIARSKFGPGNGIDSFNREIHIWVPKNLDDFDMNSIYLTARFFKTEAADLIPLTTRKEVFCHNTLLEYILPLPLLQIEEDILPLPLSAEENVILDDVVVDDDDDENYDENYDDDEDEDNGDEDEDEEDYNKLDIERKKRNEEEIAEIKRKSAEMQRKIKEEEKKELAEKIRKIKEEEKQINEEKKIRKKNKKKKREETERIMTTAAAIVNEEEEYDIININEPSTPLITIENSKKRATPIKKDRTAKGMGFEINDILIIDYIVGHEWKIQCVSIEGNGSFMLQDTFNDRVDLDKDKNFKSLNSILQEHCIFNNNGKYKGKSCFNNTISHYRNDIHLGKLK